MKNKYWGILLVALSIVIIIFLIISYFKDNKKDNNDKTTTEPTSIYEKADYDEIFNPGIEIIGVDEIVENKYLDYEQIYNTLLNYVQYNFYNEKVSTATLVDNYFLDENNKLYILIFKLNDSLNTVINLYYDLNTETYEIK